MGIGQYLCIVQMFLVVSFANVHKTFFILSYKKKIEREHLQAADFKYFDKSSVL